MAQSLSFSSRLQSTCATRSEPRNTSNSRTLTRTIGQLLRRVYDKCNAVLITPRTWSGAARNSVAKLLRLPAAIADDTTLRFNEVTKSPIGSNLFSSKPIYRGPCLAHCETIRPRVLSTMAFLVLTSCSSSFHLALPCGFRRLEVLLPIVHSWSR